MVRHLVDAAVVDADLAEVHRDAEGSEEIIGRLDRLVCNVVAVLCCVEAEDIDAVLRETVDGVVVQDVLHPSRRNDREALAVRDVIVRGQGVLEAMARPQGAAVAEGENTVAGEGAVQHHLGAGGIILRIFDALATVHHEALERCLHHAVIEL